MEEIEIGSVIELSLTKKLPEHELLLFKIGNHDASLHISELSNNRTLSEKMFSVIEIGELVLVVVINHNSEKTCFELSTKIFRNALDDILPFSKAKKIIETQFDDRVTQKEQFLFENRKMLDRLRGDLSSTELTFLYELIQNAVDHPNEKNYKNQVSIKFEIFDNFLLLKHNGALFTENNFQSITGILVGERTNETDIRRIGYKGIGFKSVFRYSQNVYVRSGNFSFCFSKALCDAEIGTEKPWEVIPFFQNEIDKIDEIKQFEFFNVPVAFAFEFPSQEAKNEVIEYLKQLASNPYLLIFLENLIKLDIVLPDDFISIEKSVRKDEALDIISLEQNGITLSDWIVFSNPNELKDEKIITELLDENNKSVPNNFRNFRTPTVSVVIPKDDQENLVNLFTYLPLSKTRYGLPYIVNADFIPNLDRTDIIPSLEYNFKVAEFVGEELLKAAQLLAQNKKYDYLIKLLPNYDQSEIRLKNVIKEKFVAGSKDYQIYPTLYSDELCTIQELLIDKTGISSILTKEEFELVTGLTHKPLSAKIIEVEIIEKLIVETQFGEIYDLGKLKESLKKESFIQWLKTPENNIKVIKYFSSRDDLKPLLKEAIILSNSGELKKSSELYSSVPPNALFTNVEVLHHDVSTKLAQEEITLNTKKYDSLKFFEDQFTVQYNPDKNEDILNFWNWVYDEWEKLKEEKDAIKCLKSKNILVEINPEEKKSIKISEAYQSKAYDPNSEVEAIIEQIGISVLFVSPDLISSDKETSQWLKIFKFLGVKTDLQDLIGDLIDKLPNIDSQKHLLVGKEVFKYWKKHINEEDKKLTPTQISSLKKSLKIKCIDGKFRDVGKVILSDHYSTNKPLEKVLPIIKLSNSISPDYDSAGRDISNWSTFLQTEIECKVFNEKQNVLEQKISFYTGHQEEEAYRKNHVEILRELSAVYSNRKNNNLKFNFDSLEQIKLCTSKDQWVLPSKVHFSSSYKPVLDLQPDESLSHIHFLSANYSNDQISKELLTKLGVVDNFRIHLDKVLHIDSVAEKVYVRLLENISAYQKRLSEIRKIKDRLHQRSYSDPKIRSVTYVYNHVSLNYSELISHASYKEDFLNFLRKTQNINLLLIKTELKIWGNNVYPYDNYVLNSIKTNPTMRSEDGEFKEPTKLFSKRLSKYIKDNSLLPSEDYTGIFVDEDKQISLESVFGIQQNLSPELTLQLISKEQVSLTSDEVDALELIKVLSGSTREEGKLYKLPNQNYEWKFCNELFMASNENFEKEIPHEQILHPDFQSLRGIFDIQTLSEDNLVLSTQEQENVTDDIIEFFNLKGRCCIKNRETAFLY
ncbi:MAG: hypothetical protein R2828_29510 [Saprospiraceae bacterium]